MKTTKIFFAALIAAVSLSCTQEAEAPESLNGGNEVEFTASWAQEDESRTVLQENGADIWWSAKEDINVFFGVESSGKFTSTNTEPQEVATFRGTLNTIIGSIESYDAAPAYWAIYPYDEDNTSDGQSVTLKVHDEQSGVAGTFADHFFPAVATGESFRLAFYNICGGARFSVVTEGVQRVVFRSNDGSPMAGTVKVAFGEDNRPEILEVSDARDSIVVLAPEGGFIPSTHYFATMIPQVHEKSITIVCYTSDKKASKSLENKITVHRSAFGALDNLDEGPVYERYRYAIPEIVDLGLSVKWASFNLGATQPEEYGDYFAWGETEPKSDYSWATYKWYNGSNYNLTKYNTISLYGAVDNISTLTPEDDAVTSHLGDYWRTPTQKEWEELLNPDNCVWEWTTLNGNYGSKVTSKKDGCAGNWIFIPAAGHYNGTGLHFTGVQGYYWSSTLDSNPSYAHVVDNNKTQGGFWDGSGIRCHGRSIRPIYLFSDEPNPDDAIQFADPIAKYACLEKFDTNGDGEVSYAEAAAATSLSGLFTDWNTVTLFDEIRFFTSVTSTENVFTGLPNLKRITIPDNITTLGTFQNCAALDTVALPAALNALPANCFDGCTALKSVKLPEDITAIPNYAFRNCSSLETLAIPSTITSIGQYAFRGCTVLAGIDLPYGLKTIGGFAFQNCQAIALLDFPASLSSIGQYAYSICGSITSVSIGNGVSIGTFAFSDCASLTTVVLPEDMTSIPEGCFYNCTVLANITWPMALTDIGANAFYGCFISEDSSEASTIELPATVKTIGYRAFIGIRHLIMPSTSAISIASDSFAKGYTRLYVPAGMVEMYKVRTNWSAYKNQIYPISDYPVTTPIPYSVPEPEAVDLGLSVKWASFNLGATKPGEYGDYIAWGETEPYYIMKNPLIWENGKSSGYSWSTYKWCMNGSDSQLTKYCNNSSYGYEGFTDNKTVLDLEDDAAAVALGGSWRMPTLSECQELLDNCTKTWTTLNGAYGRKFTSNKTGYTDKWIFLPASGYRGGTNLGGVGSYGYYLSSSLNTDSPYGAYGVRFNSGYVGWGYDGRYYGFSVRPVTE